MNRGKSGSRGIKKKINVSTSIHQTVDLVRRKSAESCLAKWMMTQPDVLIGRADPRIDVAQNMKFTALSMIWPAPVGVIVISSEMQEI